MATLQSENSPAHKIEIGNNVLCGVDAIDSTPIMNRVAAFKKAHEQFLTAEIGVRRASRAVENQRVIIAVANVNLNVAIEALAITLSNDGFPRRQPFAPFGAAAPSLLQRMSLAEGAAEVIALEAAILRYAGISTKTSHSARAAGDAARKLLERMKPIEALEKAWTFAIVKREAFAPAWEKAFSSLKLAARAADDDGYEGIFAALFNRPMASRKKASNKRNVPAKPDEAPLSAPPSV